MGKKYQRREHVAVRKKREEEQKLAKRQAFYQRHKKQMIIAAVALVLAVAVTWLAVDYFYTPGGSMRMFLGNLLDAKPNTIIRNMGTTKAPLYYQFGTFDAPAGYTRDAAYNPPSDAKEQNFYFKADDAAGPAIQSVYVAGVKDRTGQAMVEEVGASGMYASITEPKEVSLAGHTVRYLYAQGYPSEEDQTSMYAVLIMYVDTVKESCILVNATSATLAPDALPTEEAMIREAEALLAGLTVPAV